MIDTGSNRPHRLRWSHPGRPYAFHSQDWLDVMDGGEAITCIRSFGDHLVIFKNRSIWRLDGYDSSSWQLSNVDPTMCAGSVLAVESGPGVIWLANDRGVFAYDGSGVTRVSDKIQTLFDGGD